MPDKNKNNMNTCYDEIRMNPKRFSEDSRHSTNKLSGYNPFESNQSSVKRSSKLKRREYMDSAAERVPEEKEVLLKRVPNRDINFNVISDYIS